MKPKMKRQELQHDDDIWNAVIGVISEKEYPFESKDVQEAWVAYQYFSEMESGGHEALLNWLGDYIQAVGIQQFRNELIGILGKIGAHEYAAIEEEFLEPLWQLHMALEKDEIPEEPFYEKIEPADAAYYGLDGKLQTLLERYFVEIHTELIDVVE